MDKWKKLTALLCGLGAVAASLASCGYHKDKRAENSGDESGDAGGSEGAGRGSGVAADEDAAGGPAPSYALVRKLVFKPKCLRCHSGSNARNDVHLDQYSLALENLEDIERAVFVERTMPPNSKLTGKQRALLRDWIRAGGPLEEVPTENPMQDQSSEAGPEKSP